MTWLANKKTSLNKRLDKNINIKTNFLFFRSLFKKQIPCYFFFRKEYLSDSKLISKSKLVVFNSKNIFNSLVGEKKIENIELIGQKEIEDNINNKKEAKKSKSQEKKKEKRKEKEKSKSKRKKLEKKEKEKEREEAKETKEAKKPKKTKAFILYPPVSNKTIKNINDKDKAKQKRNF